MRREGPGAEASDTGERTVRIAIPARRPSATRSASAIIALALAIGALTLRPTGAATYSDGPPPGHTGGFGEPTCRSCHFDHPLQPTRPNLSVSGLPATFVPGSTYRLEIELLATEARRAGFQLAVRLATGPDAGDQAGRLEAVDDRVSVVTAPPSGIQYAQHTRRGSAVEPAGPVRWSLNWTAPSQPRVPVALHVAANAGNGDDSEFGDRIYLAELIVDPAPPAAGQGFQASGASSHMTDAQGQVARFQVGKSEFRGLSVAGGGVVWAGGRGGVFAHTTDGGKTWRADTIPGAEGLFLVDAHAVDARTAYLLGTDFDGGLARIYRTDDAGATWTVQFADSAPGTFFDGMAFWNDRHGVAFGDPVGGAFVIVTTRDGGASWSRVPAEAIPEPLPGEAGFAASGTAIAVHGSGHAWFGTGGGERARVFRTEDGGTTWKAHDTPLRAGRTAGIFGLTFWDSENGVAVGGDYTKPNEPSLNVLRTTDGGRTWELIAASAPAGVRYGVTHVPGTAGPTLVAVGPSGWGRSPDAGRTWSVIDTLAHNAVTAAPNGGPTWAAGPQGRITRIKRPAR